MLTRSIAAVLTSACLFLPFLRGSQDPEPPAEGPVSAEPDEPPPDAWQLDEKWTGLLGAWQMMSFEHSTEIVDPNSIRGYLTFQEGFMAMVIHKASVNATPQPLGQAGIYRWQMTPGGVLQTATMMGHSNFGEEDFEWEPPNVPREFRIALDKDDLVLTRPDLSRLIFRRVRPGAFPQVALERIKEQRGDR